MRGRPAAVHRAAMADRWVPRVYTRMRYLLRGHMNQVIQAAERGALNVPTGLSAEWEKDLAAALMPMLCAIVRQAMLLAEQEFGAKSLDADRVRSKAISFTEAGGVVASSVGSEDDFLLTADLSGVSRYIERTAGAAARATAKRAQAVFDQAATEHWDYKRTSRELLRVAAVDTPRRALVWARTGTMWGFNHGAHLVYKKNGIQVEEWVTARDDLTCIDCQQLDGVRVRTDEPFVEEGADLSTSTVPWNIEHPPLHPNCRCTMVPVLQAELSPITLEEIAAGRA